MAESNELRLLLTEATQGHWIENGILVGPTVYEADASTSEDEPSAWITFKTPQPESDRALWILLRNNADALLRLWSAAEAVDSMFDGYPDEGTWPITRHSPILEALAALKAGSPASPVTSVGEES